MREGEGMKDPADEQMIRPVRCQFCNRQMYYMMHARHIPEVCFEVQGGNESTPFYAHACCWNRIMRELANIKDWPQIP